MTYRLKRDAVVAWFLSGWALLTGLTVVSFDERFTARSWRFGGFIPGGYQTWGGVLIACGLLMLAARIGPVRGQRRRSLFIGGLVLTGLWWITLGLMFLYTAIVDPLANPLGVAVWTPLGALYWIWAGYEYRRL